MHSVLFKHKTLCVNRASIQTNKHTQTHRSANVRPTARCAHLQTSTSRPDAWLDRGVQRHRGEFRCAPGGRDDAARAARERRTRLHGVPGENARQRGYARDHDVTALSVASSSESQHAFVRMDLYSIYMCVCVHSHKCVLCLRRQMCLMWPCHARVVTFMA